MQPCSHLPRTVHCVLLGCMTPAAAAALAPQTPRTQGCSPPGHMCMEAPGMPPARGQQRSRSMEWLPNGAVNVAAISQAPAVRPLPSATRTSVTTTTSPAAPSRQALCGTPPPTTNHHQPFTAHHSHVRAPATASQLGCHCPCATGRPHAPQEAPSGAPPAAPLQQLNFLLRDAEDHAPFV